jgi:hypothetical protein
MPETLVSLAGLPDERDVPPADKTIEPGKDNIGTINARLSKLPKMTVSGTHPSDGRDRSPTLDPSYWKLDDDRTNDGWPTRNIWEAQAGIDIIGEDEIDGTVWDYDVLDNWGDGLSASGSGSGLGYKPARGLRAHGGTWSRLGRCAATAYVSDFEWDATVVKRRASDVYHLEMGGNPRLAVENHTVRGIIDLESDPGRFATLASGAGMANITLEQNIARTFEVFVNGDPGPDGKPLARNLRVLGNESAETVRSFLRAFTVAGVDVRNNKAPIYARNNPYSYNGQKGLQLEGCPGPNITTPNRFTYV